MYMEVVALIQSQPDVEQHCTGNPPPTNSAVIHRDQTSSDFSFWVVVICSEDGRGGYDKVDLLDIATALTRAQA